ncbi:MAG: DUF5074 domain-containing protein [Janthinobacterium lividum]
MPTFSSFGRPALLLAFAAFVASCERTPDVQPTPTTGSGNNVYITNEGAFGSANGSVTLFDKTTKTATTDLFQNANSRALGDVVQSMTVYNGLGYLVVNNSNKVEVVNLPSFRSAATISTLKQPRYLVATTANRAYVTEWLSGAAGQVSILDLTSNAVVGTLPTGRYPEKLLYYNNTVYVPNSDENTVTIIDATQQKVTSTLTVSDGPSSLVADRNGSIWVLCGGITRYGGAPNYPVLSSSPGALIRFSPGTPSQQLSLPFAAGVSPSGLRLSPDGSQLYYRAGRAEYRLDATASALPTTPLIRRGFYGFNIDPADGTLYGSIASFSGSSKTIRYRPDGTAVDSFATGIGSNGAAFY